MPIEILVDLDFFFFFVTVLGGLKFELEEVEAKSDSPDYSYTTAFMLLFQRLITSGIPHTARIFPYVYFVYSSIFLGYDERNYKIPSKKWKVAAYALKILYTVRISLLKMRLE